MKHALLKNFLIWDKWSFDPFRKTFVFYTLWVVDENGGKLYKAKRWWGPEKYTDFLKCLTDKRLRKNYTPNWGEFV